MAIVLMSLASEDCTFSLMVIDGSVCIGIADEYEQAVARLSRSEVAELRDKINEYLK